MPKEDNILEDFYTYCLTTCSGRRLGKIKNVMVKSREIIKKDLTKLEVKDVVLFLSKINQSDYKNWTKNDYKKIFKRFLKWYYKDLEMIEGLKVKEGFKGVSKKRAFNKEKINPNTLIKPEELEKLIRAAKSLKWKAIVSFMYESAFRNCEVRALRWKDIKFSDSEGMARVFIVSPKTQDSRQIPIKNCVVHLKRWREEYQFPNRNENDFVFPSQNSQSKPLGDGVLTEMFKRLSKTAKIRPVFPYLLRHSRIFEIQKRLPEKIAAKFAGHGIETSEIYNHIGSEDVEESMLKEIYPTEEISEEKNHELEKEIEFLKDSSFISNSFMKLTIDFQSGNITREKYQKLIGVLAKVAKEKNIETLPNISL